MKSFALAIVAGTLLLMLPLSNRGGIWASPVDALFTATSATCVTGLVVVDTGTHFTGFGQCVILALIQTGGLGIMTFGTLLLVAVGRRISIRHEKVVLGAIGTVPVRGLRRILLLAVGFTFAAEAVGALILAQRFLAQGIAPARSAWLATFHAVSAFCNAGFSLFPDSLMGVRDDPLLLLVIATLVTLGGLGFLVVHNLAFLHPWRRDRTRRGRLALHSRLVLASTGLLVLGGWVLFALLEWHGTLAALPWTDRLAVALFQSVTPRTAGFNAVDMATVSPPALLLTVVLMFVGGGSGSAAGGIKVGTAAVLWLTMVSLVRGRAETVWRGRAIPPRVVREAVSIFVLGIASVVLLSGALLVSESSRLSLCPGRGAFDMVFEAVSAFGTVGLSTGVTASLSPVGKLLVTVGMFVGRLGPLSLALVVGRGNLVQAISFPEEEVFVG